jgi:hypothetical protein
MAAENAIGALYVLGDGDRVRVHVERRLLRSEFDELRTFSSALTNAVTALARDAQAQLGADVVMAGGDDILLRIPAASFSIEKLRDLSLNFAKRTGCTITFGVAPTIEGAFICLRRGKAAGGNIIIAEN